MPYVLYGARVTLFCAFFCPQIYVVFFGVSMGSQARDQKRGLSPWTFPCLAPHRRH
jgi:hypothetical protein